MFKKLPDCFPVIFLFILSLFIFSQNLNIHGLGFRDDEVFYVQSTQEMLQTGDYLSPTYFGKDRFQKPILFYWFIILFYKLFGVSWEAARLVSVVFASLTVCVTWLMAYKVFRDWNISYLSSLILISTPMFYRHAQNAVPDMAMNFFIVFAVYCFISFLNSSYDSKYSYLFFISCALGFMIKGFAALIVPFGVVFLYAGCVKQWNIIQKLNWIRGTAIVLVLILPWFAYMIIRHGMSYLQYMVVDETQGRLLGESGGSFIVERVKIFLSNTVFYLRVLFSLFLPWSLFGLLAVPIAFLGDKNLKKFDFRNPSANLLLLWMALVFGFFCFMSFAIHHYILVLSTPFAIIISYIVFFPLREGYFQKSILCVREIILWVGLLTIFFLLFLLFFVFLNNWIVLYGVFFAGLGCLLLRLYVVKNAFFLAFVLSGFILIAMTQMYILNDQGLTAHAKLKEFAEVIHKDAQGKYKVGVASHDLHEKEFQVYFNRPVETMGNDRMNIQLDLLRLFLGAGKEEAYFLIKSSDYDENKIKKYTNQKLSILYRDKIIRKRLKLDGNFLKALIQLDRMKLQAYFVEEVYLVRKDGNGRK